MMKSDLVTFRGVTIPFLFLQTTNTKLDTSGMHMEVMNVLSDFNTGLTVNSRLIREGKHIRMAEIYMVTPKGDKLSVTEEGVTILNVDFNNTYTFDKARDIRSFIFTVESTRII